MKSKSLTIISTITLICTLLIACSGCGSTNVTVNEGEPANGFLWENNYSEITITGYVGASNELVIPETINGKPVTKIVSGAFKGFEALTSVKIPKTVKIIDGAFEDCTSLKSVTLSEGIESMNGTFIECTSLESIVIPKSVTSLDSTFGDCNSLKEVTFLGPIDMMNTTFDGCSSLESIVIPEGSLSEQEYISFFAAGLKTLVLPESFTGYLALDGLDSIEKISMSQKSLNMTIETNFDSRTRDRYSHTYTDEFDNVFYAYASYNSAYYDADNYDFRTNTVTVEINGAPYEIIFIHTYLYTLKVFDIAKI